MTLESISIEGFKPQAVPHQGQYPSATVSPVRHPSDTLFLHTPPIATFRIIASPQWPGMIGTV